MADDQGQEDPENVVLRVQSEFESKKKRIAALETELRGEKDSLPLIKARLEDAERKAEEALDRRRKEAFECALCKTSFGSEEPFVPVSLDCKTHLHTFCRQCLLRWRLEKSAAGDQTPCPSCKSPFLQRISHLKINHQLASYSRKRKRGLEDSTIDQFITMMAKPRLSCQVVWDLLYTLRHEESLVRQGLKLLEKQPALAKFDGIPTNEVFEILRSFPNDLEIQNSALNVLNRSVSTGESLTAQDFTDILGYREFLPQLCPALLRFAATDAGKQTLIQHKVS
eukprot:2631727-Rhodomonas_salina.2